MTRDGDQSSGGGDGPSIGRRPLLGSLAAAGLAGCPAQSGDPATSTEHDHEHDEEQTATATTASGWGTLADEYYQTLASQLEGLGLPPGRFRYGNAETDALDAFTVASDVATMEAISVEDGQPFSSAVRVTVSESTENPWDVTMIGTVPDHGVEPEDVLLGVVYLRAPEASETTPTAQFVSKDDDHPSSNMVRSTPEVQPPAEWTRYYVPIKFDYSAEAGAWRWEFFLGYGPQTVDVGGIALVDFDKRVSVDELPSGPVGDGGSSDDSTDEESTDTADWETAADQRIQEHRTSDLTVEVTDANGDPVAGADIEVALQEHEFGFGTAVNADHLLNETSEGDPYREHLTELFNTAVLGNHHKWRFWEESPETADGATEWLIEKGFDVRGHVCLWANVSAWAVPPDVVRAMGREWADNGVTDPELDPEYVRQRTMEHVPAIIDHYGEDITEWEVINELTHQPGFVKAVNGVPAREDTSLDDPDPVEAPILREWFDAAREAAPEGMPLGINDYNTLAGPYESTRSDYERQIEYLNGSEAGLDFVGLQGHFNGSSALGPQQVKHALDRYADHDVRLRVTEFDMADDNWAEQDKAEFFWQFLTVVFSHPAVDDFVAWGMIDTLHWRDDAAFFAEGWEEKPTLEEYRSLVFDEWWTEESGTTDDDGTFATTGFKGEYEVTATVDGTEVTETVTLGDEATTVELSVE